MVDNQVSKGRRHGPGDVMDYTPSGAITGGDPQILGGLAVLPPSDIAAAATDEVPFDGMIVRIQNTAAAGNIGDNVWWDDNGNPVGGTAGAGAVTTLASAAQAAADFWVGTLAKALASSDNHALVRWNVANPELPHWPEKIHETKSGTYTMDAQDTGKVIHVDTDAFIITLPATSVGLEYIFINDGADAAVLVSISPDANDKIMGPDVAGTDNKDEENTKTTAIRGDWLWIRSDGTTGWYIIGTRGTWAEQS